jgi:hypothetical protein
MKATVPMRVTPGVPSQSAAAKTPARDDPARLAHAHRSAAASSIVNAWTSCAARSLANSSISANSIWLT